MKWAPAILAFATLAGGCIQRGSYPSEKALQQNREFVASSWAAFRGRWGLVPADCEPRRSDATGLLEINEDELRFYESRATPDGLVEYAPRRIVGEFDFVGEGQVWRRTMSLELQEGGRTLVRREYGQDAMPGMLRYERCPVP